MATNTSFHADLSVKGTQYYEARTLYKSNQIRVGSSLYLQHEPTNLYDQNAVAVKVASTGAMLGYLPKELARKYVSLIEHKQLDEAKILNIGDDGSHINITVRVIYRSSVEEQAKKHASGFWVSMSLLPLVAGVYAIQNKTSGRIYIGSSNNVRERVRSHIRELNNGSHPNKLLQLDFEKLGNAFFEAKLLETTNNLSQLLRQEERVITDLLYDGKDLYNVTDDGQGRKRGLKPSNLTESISDRMNRQNAEALRQEKTRELEIRQRKVLDNFESKSEAIKPRTYFWRNLVIIFILLMTLIATFDLEVSQVNILLPLTIAALISHAIRKHAFSRHEVSREYKQLVSERDAELRKIQDDGLDIY